MIENDMVASKYYELLLNAYDWCNSVDDYDVHSKSLKSLKTFNDLCKKQEEAQRNLICFILDNKDDLIKEFEIVNK
jgi:hypothetical protein